MVVFLSPKDNCSHGANFVAIDNYSKWDIASRNCSHCAMFNTLDINSDSAIVVSINNKARSVMTELAPLSPPAWASCQIRKIAGAHAPGMPGTFSLSPHVSDPDMHHGTCVTHVPWCMPGSLTSGFIWNRRQGKTFPAFPAHAQPAILRIWEEAHGREQRSIELPALPAGNMYSLLKADLEYI